MDHKEDLVFDDRSIRPESVVLAKTATMRKLSASGQRTKLDRPPCGAKLRRNQSLTRLEGGATSPGTALRRPATAASTHSRIHQALRRSESEFVFSSKQSTVDGFLYSSRFQQTASQRPASSQPQGKAKTRHRHAHKSPPRPPHHHRLSMASPDKTLAMEAAATEATPSPGTSAHRHTASPASKTNAFQRKHLGTHPPESGSHSTVTTSATDVTTHVPRFDEAVFIQRKRRCAQTFEEMILARVRGDNNAVDCGADHNFQKLLDDGIISSIVALCNITDVPTQVHCCRALYYLSQVPFARKAMVVQGVVTTIKVLARTTSVKPRQDLAAILCHLSEEHGLVEAMLFEGIDRSLIRLFATNNAETRRICALAVFNISSDATNIKHFVESFSQLLIASTKSSYGNNAASSYLIRAVYNVALVPMFHGSLLGEIIPRFLATQLPSVQDSIKILALKALISLCDVKANRLQILTQPFCKLLENMLGTRDLEVQEMALLVLLLLSIDEGSRIKLCNWVPASSILQAASIHLDHYDAAITEPSLVYLDSCIMRNLCDSVLTHHELVEDGAVHLLLQMSRLDDSVIKSNAVCALCSIIASSTDESSDYVDEIIEVLILLTRSPLLSTCLFAVGAIYNISCSDDCLPQLVDSTGLLERVLELATTSPHDRIADLIAAIVYRLTTIEEMQSKLLKMGFLPILVHLVHHFPTCRTYAVNALYLLAQDSSDKFPHGGEEIWQLTCALSDDGLRKTVDEAAAARCAVTLMAHLARDRGNHSILVRNGTVFRFLKGLRKVGDLGDETILMNSAFVYYSLTVSQEGCDNLIRENGIEELIHISRTTKLSSENNQLVKEVFMMAMVRISSFIGLEVRLIEHGAIDAVMVLALVTTDNSSIKALCIKTLANCLVSKNCVRPLIEHGVIWALSSLANVDSNETRHACAVSLCNLAAVPHMLSRFLDAGAPRALIHLLQKSTDASTTLIVIKAIANLVANEKICLALTNEDIEKHLSVHFVNPTSSDEIRQLAAMILLRVTSANDAVLSLDLLKHGVFVWMEQIIVMLDDALVRNCMLTVHDLTCSTTIDMAELDVDHILRIVIQVFTRHSDSTDVLTLCLWIVYNLSCQSIVLHKLVQPDIMAFVRRQVPISACPFPMPEYESPTPATIACQGGLCLSPADTTNFTDPLATSLTASNPNNTNSAATICNLDVKLSCLILHNISCYSHEMSLPTPPPSPLTEGNVLADLVNAKAVGILSDIYVHRADLKETCAIAVCNLAVGKVNSTRIVDDNAGRLLVHFVFSDLLHRCHLHLISVAIRKLVNAPGNQPRLLSEGIGKAIVRVLGHKNLDLDATRNLVASLCLLSRCKTHLTRLLQDGALLAVISVSESKGAVGGNSELLGYCFEILSNLCTVNFEAYATSTTTSSTSGTNRSGDPAINVINTLTRLSEVYQATPNGQIVAIEYYERGVSRPLALAQLLTYMLKAPSSSVKKNLELQSTFQVPSRKWIPDAQPNPVDCPLLECTEIALTEGNQSIPDAIRQRIRGLVPLDKERLVRDEKVGSDDTHTTLPAPSASHSDSGRPDDGGECGDDRDESGMPGAMRVFGSSPQRVSKKLQRGVAGRNLSLSMAMASTNALHL